MDIVCMDIQKKTTPPIPLGAGVCIIYISLIHIKVVKYKKNTILIN